PGVTIELWRNGAVERKGVTDDRGEIVFQGLQPGQYRVTATLDGFNAAVLWSRVTAGTTTVPVELKVGAIEETVTVSGASPRVSVQSTLRGLVRREHQFNTEAYDKIDENGWQDA